MPSSRLCLIPLLPQLADVPCAVVVGNAKGGMVPNIQLIIWYHIPLRITHHHSTRRISKLRQQGNEAKPR